MDDHIKKIAVKFSKLKSPSDEEDLGLHTFTMGAIYSYARLNELNYDEQTWGNRDWNKRYEEVNKITKYLSEGKINRSSQWLAEYYYNNLVHRLDVAFERVAKRILHNGSNMRNAIRSLESKPGYKTEWANAWEKVRDKEANPIKHHSPQKLLSPNRLNLKELENVIFCLIDAIKWAQSQPKHN